MGRLLDIATRPRTRAPMELHQSRALSPEAGVDGDLRGRPGRRQVTVVSRESWEAACAVLGRKLPWTARRANLLVEGVELEGTPGRRLRVGEAWLEVTGETEPCARMDEAAGGLRAALEPSWRGGITCRVLFGATIFAGDPVGFE